MLNILKQIFNLIIKNGNSRFLKNNYQLVEILKKIKKVKIIITFDFTDLFKNIDIDLTVINL